MKTTKTTKPQLTVSQHGMKTYIINGYRVTSLKRNTSKQGEMIEQKIERIVSNKEPIKDGAPLIYTDRKEGVRPSTDIRTDRFEVAIEATDKIAKSYKARREERAKAPDGKTESIQGKDETSTEQQKPLN